MPTRPLQLVSRVRLARAPGLRRSGHDAALLALLARRRQLGPEVEPALRRGMRHRGATVPGVLLAGAHVRPADLLAAEAELRGATPIDPAVDPPDPRLIDRLGAPACLGRGLLPWRRVGAATVIATARPDLFARAEPGLAALYGPVIMALATPEAISSAILVARGAQLVRRAETLVAPEESCRDWSPERLRAVVATCVAGTALAAAALPRLVLGLVLAWAVLTLLATAGLKLAAALAEGLARLRHRSEPPPPAIARLPVVSLLVPMVHEPDIAPRLIARLARLDYPEALLDVLLVVEEGDAETRTALAARHLPAWMRVLPVPPGSIKTKPRAMNFALPFCRGSIVGVYDAEDAPAPDQLRRVVERFHARPESVACLQGVLDFYNPRANWLSRCFTVEYAAWFRIVLPGLARLGLAVPLGGTTLFFRREALEALGGWDAHNVTEDADLGLRLARHGYRAELIDVVTEEEANCRALPWVRQRSRWLKGYMITWAVHMRDPLLLWRQLGPRRFLGAQVLFVGTLSQFLLAPLLWTCWVMLLGLPHPLRLLPPPALALLSGLFVASEVVNVAVNLAAVSGPKHRWLIPWVPTLAAYFTLGALAAYKGAWELMGRPFYWDKTRHGLSPPETEAHPAMAVPEAQNRPEPPARARARVSAS